MPSSVAAGRPKPPFRLTDSNDRSSELIGQRGNNRPARLFYVGPVNCRVGLDVRNVVLLRNEHFIKLDDRLNIRVIWHVALEYCCVRHEGSEKVFNGIEEKVAHCNVCRF